MEAKRSLFLIIKGEHRKALYLGALHGPAQYQYFSFIIFMSHACILIESICCLSKVQMKLDIFSRTKYGNSTYKYCNLMNLSDKSSTL